MEEAGRKFCSSRERNIKREPYGCIKVNVMSLVPCLTRPSIMKQEVVRPEQPDTSRKAGRAFPCPSAPWTNGLYGYGAGTAPSGVRTVCLPCVCGEQPCQALDSGSAELTLIGIFL